MKKILLFISIVFFALYSNKTNAQIINSFVVSSYIQCPGDQGTLDVFISNPNSSNYSIVLQKQTITTFGDNSQGQWLTNTQATFHQFTGLNPGFYRVLLVDPSCTPPYNSAFILPPDPCIYSSATTNLSNPSTLTISSVDDTINCWYDTESITINLTGMQPPYTVRLEDSLGNIVSGPTTLGQSQSSYTFQNLSAGIYSVKAIGFFLCGEVSDSFQIFSPDTILINAGISKAITCLGGNDGEITINGITGGSVPPTPDYTITMSGPTGTNTIALTAFPIIIQNLSPGSYQLTVIDEFGCDTISDVFTFVDADSLGASTTFIDPTCDGYTDGEITITIDPIFQGEGPDFQWTEDGGLNWLNFFINPTSTTIFGLGEDIYSDIIVRDINGCEFNLPVVTLTDLDPVTFDLTPVDYNSFQVSCNGVCDGIVTLSGMLGGAGAPYSIGGVTIFVDTIRDSICGATIANGGINYIDTIEDAIGCLGVDSINIFEPEVFSISANTVLLANGYNVACPGTCDGEISVAPTNGVDTINYFISSLNSIFASSVSPNSVQAINICGENTNNGQDTIIAIDANQCVDTAYISLLEPNLFTFEIDSVNENCATSNGKAWVYNLNGGLPPYSYSWTGPLGPLPYTDSIIENLSYGQYNVTVTDSMGCDTTLSILVDSSFILVDPITVLVPCNGINGAITINTNGVLLSNVVLENLTTSTIIENYNSFYIPAPPTIGGVLVQNPNIDTVMTFDNLTSGQYELRVELYGLTYPSQGCASVAYPITVGAAVTMDATLDLALSELDLLCFGDMTDSIFIDVTDGFNLNPNSPFDNSYSAYTIDPLGPQNVSISVFNHNFLIATGGFTAGNYDIVITPAIDTFYLVNGVLIQDSLFTNCYDTVSVTVTEPDSLEFTLGSVQTLCYGDSTGTIFVDTIFGGNSGQYNYTWKDNLGQILGFTNTVSSLPAGWYFLTVLDSLSCTPATIDSIFIAEPLDITWTATIAAIDSCEYTSSTGAIVLTTTGGMGPHSYMWNGLDANGNPFTSPTQNLFTLTSGMYYITITDTNSCTKNDSVFIENGQNPSLDSSSFTNVSCFGAHDGSYIGIADSVNGSLSFPYTFYNFSSNAFVSGYIPSDSLLGPGDTINIRLKDNFGCVDSSFYVITEPDLLKIDSLIDSTFIGGYNVSCNGSSDGQITISGVTGGTPNYSYWLQDTISPTYPLSIDSVFSGLAARYYMAYVIDAHGCLDSLNIYLDQPDSLLIDSFSIHTYIGGNNVSCDGFSDGAAQVYVSGGNQIYSYIWSSAVADSLSLTDTVVNLNAISYTVNVTDPNGCIVIDSIYLTQPTPLVINSFSTTQLLCKGGDRGSSTVNVSGSIAGYTYLWDNANSTIPTYINPSDTVPSMNDITAFADTLRAGWYNVGVWDMNGCYITDSVELTEPIISITIDSLIVSQMTCFTYDNASVGIIATGPEPIPYLYSVYEVFNPLNITQGNLAITSGLSLGNYVAMVEDGLDCLDRDTFTINPYDSVYIDTVVFNNVSCYGFNDGYIQNIVHMGGTAPYLYSINGGTKYPDWLCTLSNTCIDGYIFNGLGPGVYDVEIWDANGCANSYKITINEPAQMSVSITTNSYNNYQILCNGDPDSAVVNVSGGLSPYTLDYSIISLISNSGSFNPFGIFAGVYTFTIADNNSCTYIETVTFNEPNLITFIPIITDVFCQDSCTGEITAIVAGGVGLGNGSNYSYQWYEDAAATILMQGENSYNIDSLCPGDYTIIATDANGCTGLLTPTIGGNVLQINIASTTINDVSCDEICDGLIDINVSGGVPASSGAAYNYVWSDVLAQTATPAIGLCAGSYTCTVWDNATPACTVVTSLPILVAEPNPFIANIILNNAPLCNGDPGDLSITTTGGTNPISSYAWSDGTNGISTIGLAGNYSCFVVDANGCSDTAHYNLLEPTILTILDSAIVVFDVKCKGESTGEIHITASGGTPIPGIPGTYDYYLFDLNGTPQDTLTHDSTAQFTGLSTGSYYVVVTDYNGCIYTTGNMFIDEPDNILEITIDGYDETCALNDAKAVVFPTGGTSPYTFKWDNGSSNPSNGSNNSFLEYLEAKSNTPHTVIVTDANNCNTSQTITLLGYKYVFLPGNNIFDSASICLGETINIDIDDRPGLTYVWTMFNGLEIDTIAMTADLTLQTDSSFSPTEILTLTITDPDCGGSHSVMATVYIDDLDPECSANELTILFDQSVTLSEIGLVNFNTYEWSNTNGEVLSNNSSFSYTPTQSDSFNLYVTDGICKGYCSVYITLGVLPYDAISPNGDGYNDTWNIQDLGRYDYAIVKLFNRWGQLLGTWKSQEDINNYPWEDLTIGTYYYIIDLGNGDIPQTGPITIIK